MSIESPDSTGLAGSAEMILLGWSPRTSTGLLSESRHRPTHPCRRLSGPERGVILHTENGMLGVGPQAYGADIDPDLINAGKIPVTETPGAAYFHHADSFAMMRGGHLDVCVLGAFQVSFGGDLANWHTGAADAIPAVGGAMDLAIGAKGCLRLDDPVRQGWLAQTGPHVHLSRPASPASVGSTPITGSSC